MKPLLVLLALLTLAPACFGQALPWRRMVEEKLRQQDRLIEQLLALRQEPKIILVPPAPFQQLPIEGLPKQELPIGGEPKQQLPGPGDPKQELPQPGPPKQDLPQPGPPRQELPQPPRSGQPQRYSIVVPALYYRIPKTYYQRIFP